MNKRLFVTLSVLVLVLAGIFVKESIGTENASENNKEKIVKVGVLQYVSHPALDQIYQGLKDELKKENFVEGKNLKIVFQNGQADQSKLTTMSQKLVEENCNVLVGIATPAAQSLANQTEDVPIVLGAVTDPVSAGLVKDLKRPEKNITGVSDQVPLKAILELAKEILPEAKTVGILYSSSEDNSKSQVEQMKKIASELGLNAKEYAVSNTNDVKTVASSAASACDFLATPTDNTIASAMQTVVSVCDKYNIPVFPTVDTQVKDGGLATVGINQHELGVETGKIVAKILNGEKVSDIPVFTFTTGEKIYNQKQADKLGITLPAAVKKDAVDISKK
jgi:putative ABC transport system substrate-binding protein